VATMNGTGEDSLSLTVTKSGTGTGTVTDATGVINCGTTCTSGFERTTSDPIVTLTAAPGHNAVLRRLDRRRMLGDGEHVPDDAQRRQPSVNAEFDPQMKTLSFHHVVYGQGRRRRLLQPDELDRLAGPCVENPTFPRGPPGP